jgi:transposase-like protein
MKKQTKVGRPTLYTEALADEICERISSGQALSKICPQIGIHITTVWDWLNKYPEFATKYTRAREAQADVLADEIIAIADDPATEEVQDGDGTRTAISSSAVQRNRLRVDARKWYASKVAPKKYGDKLDTTVSGPDGGPLQHSVTVKFV